MDFGVCHFSNYKSWLLLFLQKLKKAKTLTYSSISVTKIHCHGVYGFRFVIYGSIHFYGMGPVL